MKHCSKASNGNIITFIWETGESNHQLRYTVPVDKTGFSNMQVSYHNHFGYFQPVINIWKYYIILVVISQTPAKNSDLDL